MKINKIKINSFGNLNNKEINFSNNINIIYGKNESGKSTLLKFIVDMFYGISKNKKGKEFSDYDRFNPWNNSDDFSGKISYNLDNGEKYEVFRDFNKKNPKIYNELSEDISKNYSIDKLNGNQFFYEQTNIDEDLFLSTLVTMQQDVKLDKQLQNSLIQKVANIVNTGDDNVSYKKAIEKLNKKQIEEIGTSRSQGRPLNIINEKIEKLENEKKELINLKNKPYEIEEIKNKIEDEIIEEEEKLNLIKELNLLNNKNKIENEKINLNNNIILENKNKINNLLLEKEKINNYLLKNNKNSDNKIEDEEIDKLIDKKNKVKKISKIEKYLFFVFEIIMLVLLTFNIMLIKNEILTKILASAIPLTFIIFLFLIFKNKNDEKRISKKIKEKDDLSISKKENECIELENDLHKLNIQIEVLQKNIENLEIEINNLEEKNKNNYNFEQEKIINNYKNNLKNKKINLNNNLFEEKINYEINNYLNKNNLNEEINFIENNLNNNKLKIHSLELDKNNILPQIEKLASIEEELNNLYENKNELLKENESIELVKELLEISYNKMKNKVTPKFTNNLSKIMEKISNEKYKNVVVNDEEGILVEKENGEYVQIDKLSVGTIEQIYLSLRFSMANEISVESMPIILDEVFAYYDEDRLRSILNLLNKEYNNKQIIIFTCTNREIKILDEENINYNLISL